MARPTLAEAKDTRLDIVRYAQQLTLVRGFNSLSYADIAEKLEIKKASVHHHFKNKVDLAIAVIERFEEGLGQWIEITEGKQLNAREELELYFELFQKIQKDGSRICSAGAFAGEWNTLGDPVKTAMRKLIDLHEQWLKKVIKAGRAQKLFTDEGTLDGQVRLIMSLMPGSLQVARIQNNPGHTKIVAKQLMTLIERK